jgi:hypothetical protein
MKEWSIRVVDFVGFGKIPRLNREIIVTEKIDGTNGQIYIEDDGVTMHVGSRNRWLTETSDNMGFYRWAQENREELLKLGPGHHFGEWWGKGIQKHAGIDHKRFSLFNVSRWRDVHGTNDVWRDRFPKQCDAPSCCYVVPIVLISDHFDIEGIEYILDVMRNEGSFAAPGWMRPEGVIVFHTASGQMFKVTCENDEKPKGQANEQ